MLKLFKYASLSTVSLFFSTKCFTEIRDYVYTTHVKKHISVQSLDKDNMLIVFDDREFPGCTPYKFSALTQILEEFDEKKIVNLVLTTSGGQAESTYEFCHKFKQFYTRVFVPEYAHSAGTVIALSANELHLTRKSTLSAINPIMVLPIAVNILYDKGKLSFLDVENEHILQIEKEHDTQLRQIINSKYNIDRIINVMCLGVSQHRTFFSYETIRRLSGAKINEYSGNHIDVICPPARKQGSGRSWFGNLFNWF